MRSRFCIFFWALTLICALVPGEMQAQSDAAKTYKANCELCHGADGSGNTGPGKAFHAQDLRSADTQKQTDAQLTEVITKGRGKMPAFGAKLKPEDIQKLVTHIRSLAPTK